MDLADLLIAVLLVFAVMRGLRFGLLQLLLSSAGFILGLLVGSWLARYLVMHLTSQVDRLFLTLFVEFGTAFLFSFLGETLSIYLDESAKRFNLTQLNRALGATLEVIFVLLTVWLVAPGLSSLQTYNIGRSIRDSVIINVLDEHLPAPPNLFAQLEKVITPNGFPEVFSGLEPQHTTTLPNPAVDSQVVLAAEKSVVKIEGLGCGGLVEGSGFVAEHGIVVTNAHVIAGVSDPRVVDGTGTYHATPIWFDKDLDLAVLEVNGLPDPSLSLSSHVLDNNALAVVLGYPGGGPLTASSAVVLDKIDAIGQDIYNSGQVSRNIYELQADVEPGNSGGPLVASDGSVVGIVFARSVSQNDIGYALLMNDTISSIHQAEARRTPVTVGGCAAS